MATHLLPESAFVTDLDGAIIILEADAAAVKTARPRDRVAKRARDGGLPLREEGDACGWSSAVLERGLALRRRRGPATCFRRGCGWVVGAAAAVADEHNCRGKESTTSGPLAAEAVVQREIDDDSSYLAYIILNAIYD